MQGPIACSQREEDAIGIQDLECLAEPTEFEAAAIAAWNSLPRRPDYNDVDCAGCPERRRSALRWTHEPPKVAGWYWCRASTLNMPRCVEVYGGWEQLMFGSKRDDFNPQMPVTREGFEWAGPIPEPLEPEDS